MSEILYEIQALKVGEADVPGPEVYWMSHWGTWETLYFYTVLIRGGGRTILVNTGPPADLTALNRAWTGSYGDPRGALRRTGDELVVNALASVGVRPAEVDCVLITPLQAYTTSNIPLFPNATICLSRRGWIEDFHAPRFPIHGPREFRIPNDVLTYLEIDAWSKLRLLDDEEQVLPGIRASWVGVHHRSSMAYFVATEHGAVAISDCFFKYANIEQNLPLGIQESMEECVRSYAMIRTRASRVLPLYDPEVLVRHPGGRIA